MLFLFFKMDKLKSEMSDPPPPHSNTAPHHLFALCFQEYDSLTNKIHELQLKEQELQEQLSNGRGSPTPTTQPHPAGMGGAHLPGSYGPADTAGPHSYSTHKRHCGILVSKEYELVLLFIFIAIFQTKMTDKPV